MLRGFLIKRYLLSAIFLIFISFLICGPAISEEAAPSADKVTVHAAEGASKAEEDVSQEEDRSADLKDLFYRFENFILLVIILVIVFKKARLMDYLSARVDEIRKRLEALKREKEAAEKKYRDIEAKLKDFESKGRDILEEYRKEGLAERDRIIDEASERVKQIINQSELAVEQEMRSVRNRLKQEIVELAIGQAKEIIQKEINEKDHDDLINEFIERVSRIN